VSCLALVWLSLRLTLGLRLGLGIGVGLVIGLVGLGIGVGLGVGFRVQNFRDPGTYPKKPTGHRVFLGVPS